MRPERFELPTYCSGGNRSIHLSYGRSAVNYMTVYVRRAQIASLCSPLLVLANIGKTLPEIRNQVLAWAGNVNRFTFALFCADPLGEFFGRGVNPPTRSGNRHSGLMPALHY